MPEGFADGSVRFVPVRDFELAREVGLLHAAGEQPSAFLEILRKRYRT